MLNIAILGLGSVADDKLAPAVNHLEEATLWSVLDVDKDRALHFAKKHGVASVFTDLSELLSDPNLHAVIIATPDRLHAEHVLQCAEARKHVLVEKPLSVDIESGRAMIKACEAAEVNLAVGYHLRWHPGHRLLIDRIRAGQLGDLMHMRAQWTWKVANDKNWRASEKLGRWWSLAGVGTHCLDMIRWVMIPACGEVVEVKSLIAKDIYKGPHDETAIISLKFRSGATAEFCSSVLFESPYRVEIYGNSGHAICHGTLGRECLGEITINSEKINYEPRNPYEDEILDFIQSIADKRSPEVDGNEGLRNIEILDRCCF